ncbi:uncharacterized protein LOC129593508 [Paramacrobiotus metropolitanus]|uniref:uncharacterized protein LOC129593508 n=1 Tax=Paramacrobiotus metropolitanus TaxID=2943436 RepID=UPI0024461272|nr:uncharacterized protein LOC129593508 [Paramacrobiotus metropolitanus]
MATASKIAVFLAVFMCIAVHQANGLRCYTCSKVPGSCPGLVDVVQENCNIAQDECFKFEGDVIREGALLKNITTKSCVAYSIIQQFSGGYKFERNNCVMVNASKDPNQNQYYTGRLCLCNDKDFCNSAAVHPISLLLLTIGLLAAVWAKL